MFGRQVSKARVLIVDHDTDSCEEMRLILSNNGYEVARVPTGGEALNRMQVRGYDIVLVDLLLPDMSGLGLLKQIKARDAEATVLLMGTHITTATILESVSHGAFDVVYKPFLSSIIIQRLDHLLSRAPLLHRNRQQRRTA